MVGSVSSGFCVRQGHKRASERREQQAAKNEKQNKQQTHTQTNTHRHNVSNKSAWSIKKEEPVGCCIVS
jgi:hypothetical protein